MSKYTLVYTLCLPTFVLSLYFEENRSGVDTFLNHHDYHTRLLTHDNDSVQVPFLVCLFVWTPFLDQSKVVVFMVDLVYTHFFQKFKVYTKVNRKKNEKQFVQRRQILKESQKSNMYCMTHKSWHAMKLSNTF